MADHTNSIQGHVLEAIKTELQHQRIKWGRDKQQSIPGYLLIMQYELNEAIDGWMKNKTDRNSALHEIVQVVTTGVACLNRYGCTGSARSTDDVSEDEMRQEYQAKAKKRFGND